MPDMNLTARRVRFKDSDLVIEITYDGMKPLTARAVDEASDWADNPDTVQAVHYVLDQAIAGYKKNSMAATNKVNAQEPRTHWAQPSPGEVVETMREMDFLNEDNSIVAGHYRAALLEQLQVRHPKLKKDALTDRIKAAKKLQLLT